MTDNSQSVQTLEQYQGAIALIRKELQDREKRVKEAFEKGDANYASALQLLVAGLKIAIRLLEGEESDFKK